MDCAASIGGVRIRYSICHFFSASPGAVVLRLGLQRLTQVATSN